MKKIIVTFGIILTILAAVTTLVSVIDYKMKNKRYLKVYFK